MTPMEKKRTYLTTHPWITFQLDTGRLDFETWLLLGEAKSKCEHLIGSPLLPEVKQKLSAVFLAKGALATTAIEGNTLSEDEVQRRIAGTLTLPPSKEYLGIEIDNVVEAYNIIGKGQLAGETDLLSVKSIEDFNRLVLKGLPLDPEVAPGRIRSYAVGIAGYRGAPVEDCEFLLERYVHWLNHEFPVPEGKQMIFGIIKAILAHIYFVWIHPFGDGNGRTARLIEFQILLAAGAPALAAHLLSNHYNATRSEYYRQLQISSKTGGDLQPFIKYALQGFVDGLKTEIDLIKDQQLHVHWINHIHNVFKDKNHPGDQRRKKLMLEWTESGKREVKLEEIRHITPAIAELYANRTARTDSRDIAELLKMDLVIKLAPKVFRPKWEILQAFLTPVRPII